MVELLPNVNGLSLISDSNHAGSLYVAEYARYRYLTAGVHLGLYKDQHYEARKTPFVFGVGNRALVRFPFRISIP